MAFVSNFRKQISLLSPSTTPMKSIVETIEHQEWSVKGWKIQFLLSDKLLNQVKKVSRTTNWYEDPTVTTTWIEKIDMCFTSIQKYYGTFGVLPQVGDRLYNEDAGMIVHERSIDGCLMTITFTLSI